MKGTRIGFTARLLEPKRCDPDTLPVTNLQGEREVLLWG